MKIAFCGAHGTGKTTLLYEIVPLLAVSENYTDLIIRDSFPYPDYQFNYRVFDGIGRRIYTEKKHWSERKKQRYFNWYYTYNHYVHPDFIGSRSIFDTFAYSRLGIGLAFNRRLIDWSCRHITYDFIFYVPVEFGLERDGIRPDDESFRLLHDYETRVLLDYYHIPYHKICGTVQQRLDTLRSILDV